MKVYNRSSLIGRAIITLLLVLCCAIVPVIGPLRAAPISKRDAARLAARPTVPDNAIRGNGQNGTQFKSLPLRFELNKGQTDSEVQFVARSRDGMVFLTHNETVLRVTSYPAGYNRKSRHQFYGEPSVTSDTSDVRSAVVRLRTVRSNAAPRITGLEMLPGKTNYFIGNDPKNWRTNVPAYAKVKYEGLYAGIDMIYYGNEGAVEYDFKVAPGADPGQIAISIEGAEGVEVDETGDLVLQTAAGEVRQHAPHIYQEDHNGKREVAGGYVLREDGAVTFGLASYDSTKPLVIDPQLVYATYLGGTDHDGGNDIAVDTAGSAYITGFATSENFPTKDPLQGTKSRGDEAAFVAKLSADGSSLVYSTYLGGTNGFNVGNSIAVDSSGSAYITGSTSSPSFPLMNPMQNTFHGGIADTFVTKLSPNGASLVYSTYLGGSGDDESSRIRLDSTNAAYVVGTTDSTDFPLVTPVQTRYGGGQSDAFLSMLAPDGSRLLASTYYGGSGTDTGNSCAIDADRNVILAGDSNSPNLPGGGLSTPSNGGYMEELVATSPTAQSAIPSDSNPGSPNWSSEPPVTFSPPNFDPIIPNDVLAISGGSLIAAKRPEKLMLCGHRKSTDGGQTWPGNPISQANEAATTPAPGTAFLLALDQTNNLIKLTTFGGIPEFSTARALAVDSQGAVYVAGTTASHFSTLNPIQSTYGGGGGDAYVVVFAPNTFDMVFATWLGGSRDDDATGIALDTNGNIYITGDTLSPNFPTLGAIQPGQRGFNNAFIAKISAVGPFQTGPDFTLGFDSPALTAQAGTKARITVNINRTGGFTGNVTVTAPTVSGIKPKPPDPITTTDASVAFKMKIGAGVAPGSYPLTFTAQDGSGHTRTATVTLIVQ